MKRLLSIFILIAAPWAGAAEPPALVVRGEVVEVRDVESYTYLRLKTRDGETWAAVSKAPVKAGTRITIENVMIMHNFESKSLKQTFKSIVFGTLAGAATGAQSESEAMAMAHAGVAKNADAADLHVTKASGANAWTVAEIITKAAELKDKSVLVRGKVVKYNPAIMGKNWMHLRDGTGAASAHTNDLVVAAMGEAKVGDVVTVKGVVRTDKDFGAGYVYKVLIDEAAVQK